MFIFSIFRRQDDRPTTRRPQSCRRRPLVEDLEGRKLLSSLMVTPVSDIQGGHIGTNYSDIQGGHIGMNSSAIQGGHIGTNVV